MKKSLTLFFVLILFSNAIYGQENFYIKENGSDRFIQMSMNQADNILRFDHCENDGRGWVFKQSSSSCVTQFLSPDDLTVLKKLYNRKIELSGLSLFLYNVVPVGVGILAAPIGLTYEISSKAIKKIFLFVAAYYLLGNGLLYRFRSNRKQTEMDIHFLEDFVFRSTNYNGNEDFFVFVEDTDELWKAIEEIAGINSDTPKNLTTRSVEPRVIPQQTSVGNTPPSSTRENASNLEELGENLVELGGNLVEIGESLPEELEELKANMLAELKEELSVESQANLEKAVRELSEELKGEWLSVQQPRQEEYGLSMTVECSCYEDDVLSDDYLGPSRGVGTTIQEAVSDARYQCPISRPVSSPEELITKDCKIIGAEFYEKSDIPTVPIDLLKLLPTLDLNEVLYTKEEI